MLLNVQELCVSYLTKKTELKAVDHVSFGIERGDTLGIIGESGSGKSTIVMAMLRQLDPRFSKITGRVEFDGQELLTLPDAEFKKLLWKRIAIVFQKSMNSLSPVHRLGSQFEDIYRVHEPHATKAQIHDRAVELFKLVNLPERVYRLYPHELSGGQLQRISILRSMLLKPRFLVVDEPVSMLDVSVRADIINMFLKLVERHNTSILFISHDISIIRYASSRVAVMYLGNIVEMGETDAIIHHPMHPYTQVLISNCASIDLDEKKEPIRIEGEPPSPVDPKPCCPFAGRCFCAQDVCLRQKPELRTFSDGRQVACHFARERE